MEHAEELIFKKSSLATTTTIVSNDAECLPVSYVIHCII
jgi:hypothetical protein